VKVKTNKIFAVFDKKKHKMLGQDNNKYFRRGQHFQSLSTTGNWRAKG
jgi:hypothetical protein